MSTLSIRDVGLRESVTPRASDISSRIAQAIAMLPHLDVDHEMAARRTLLKEWQFAIDMTIAWGRDLDADEHAKWRELLA